MSRDLAPEILRYAKDPWAFLSECCFTRDQVSRTEPIKAFPREWDYLRLYCRLWQDHPRLAVPKSRRMFMSWCNIGLYLWATLFSEGQDFAFVSKKEDDAAELVKRAEFIYDHIPESRFPRSLLPRKETKAKPSALIFPEINSKIQGFPMGADQLRSYTFSGILGDECAFWEDGEKFYSGAAPTTEGGGRMTLVSSRSPSFFQRICYDALDGSDFEETFPADAQFPMGDDSLVYWHNKKNRFHVLDIHYTANPGKRDEKFLSQMKGAMPIKQWLVEYERNWQVYEGKAVFEDYSRARHESKVPLEAHMGLPLLCGWDFGLTPACIVAQLREGTLYVLREFTAQNKSIDRFAPHVMQQLKQYFPEWVDQKRDFCHYVDPAGFVKEQVTARTCVTEMAKCGLKNISAPYTRNDIEPRIRGVEKFLLQHTKDGAGLQLYPPHCPTLAKGFAGGYRYPEKYEKVEPKRPEPIKDSYSHPHDALQYLCGGANSLMHSRPSVDIPIPYYSFQKTEQQQAAEDYASGKADYGIAAGSNIGTPGGQP